MRNRFWLPLCFAVIGAGLQAGTIQFQTTNLGGNTYQYTYFPSGFALQANQELDIRFSPILYTNLNSGVAGAGFDLALLQPNNPSGTFGDYSALALVNNPLLTGPFSVNFNYLGSGQPGSQPYRINQYNQSGAFVATIDSGVTTPVGGAPSVPEPGTLPLAGAALAAILWTVRRRAGQSGIRTY